MKVRIKSKLKCLLWCLKNGIIKPHRYFFSRIGKHKEDQHNYFSYGKFKRCGNIYDAEKVIGKDDYIEAFGYEFHKSLVDII